MICICGYETEDGPYESWEECPNCDRKLEHVEDERKYIERVALLEAVAEAADEMIDVLFPIVDMRKDVDAPAAQKVFKALAALDAARGFRAAQSPRPPVLPPANTDSLTHTERPRRERPRQ